MGSANNEIQKLCLFAAWTVALLYVVHEIYLMEKPQPRSGTPIASAKGVVGQVQFKTGDRIAWHDVGRKQEFFSGDRIATADASAAIITFAGGGEVKVGPNSQIKLAAIKSSSGLGLYIDLLQGELDANASKKGSANFLIKAGNEEIKLTRKSGPVAIAKAQGQGAVIEKREASRLDLALAAKPKLDFGQRLMALTGSTLPVFEAKESIPEPPSEVPEAVVEPVKAESAKLKAKEEQARPNPVTAAMIGADRVFWITQAFESAGKLAVPVEFRYESPQPLQGHQVYLGIGAGAVKSEGLPEVVVPASKIENGVASFYLQIHDIAKSAQKESQGAFDSMRIHLLPGVAAAGGRENVEYFGSPVSFEVRSLKTSSQEQSLLLTDAIGKTADEGLSQSRVIADARGADLPYKFYFAGADGIAGFTKLLLPAKRLSVRKALPGDDAPMIQFVRKGRVVVSVPQISSEQVKEIFKVVGADIVYIGPKEAIMGLRQVSKDQLASFLKSQSKGLKQVYAAKGTKLVPVNVDFLLTSPEARDFIDNHASAFFRSQVKVVMSR